jgi:hypothetical protein
MGARGEGPGCRLRVRRRRTAVDRGGRSAARRRPAEARVFFGSAPVAKLVRGARGAAAATKPRARRATSSSSAPPAPLRPPPPRCRRWRPEAPLQHPLSHTHRSRRSYSHAHIRPRTRPPLAGRHTLSTGTTPRPALCGPTSNPPATRPTTQHSLLPRSRPLRAPRATGASRAARARPTASLRQIPRAAASAGADHRAATCAVAPMERARAPARDARA